MNWAGRIDRPASQREVDILRSRIDQIDTQGTRGTTSTVGILASQMQDMVKDLAEWRTSTQLWQDRHEAQHKDETKARADETKARVIGRRWLTGTCIAVLVLLVAVLTLLLQLAGRVR